jgi:outer membrane protein assembly factor BamA
MKSTFELLLSTILLLSVSSPATAQKYQPKAIQFAGAPEYPEQELKTAVGLKDGMALDSAEMKEYTQKLIDTGLFASVNYRFNGVSLVFSVTPTSDLYSVHLENLPLVPGKELDAELHGRLPLYHGKVPAGGSLLEGVRGALEEMLAAKGIKANVIAMPSVDPKHNAMSFLISSPPVRVGKIQLGGASAAMQAAIEDFARHETGKAFGTEDSGTNLERAIGMFYADRGYAAAKVQVLRSGDAVATTDAIEVPFSATIEEGRIYKLGAIHLPPDAPVAQADLDKSLGAKNSSAMGQSLRDAWFMIVSRYKSKGYLDCKITPHPEFDEASGIANYTVEVNPGGVYHLASVRFENVSDELRARIMSHWTMQPGDTFDESYVQGFLAKAQKEDSVLMRSLSGVAGKYTVATDPETHEVTCVMRLVRLQQTK